MKHILTIAILFTTFCAFSQEIDTVKTLEDVTVKAYAYDKPLQDIPAAVGKISTVDLERFSNTNFLPAFNTQPGVRMEERSPGSYRLSIRGSTLRSPFGIRNVKIYFNGIPLTDNGGNTYLNLLDFNSIDELEIIKGPGSSLYGAGTGGVLLLNKKAFRKEKISAGVLGGSYGLNRYNASLSQNFSKSSVSASYSHQQSDGYREQSAMRRDIFNLHSSISINDNSSFDVLVMYSDLEYQTPGGLTKIQYDTLPSMARPNATARKTAIHNKTYFGGVSWNNDWNKNFTTTISAFGNITDFKNPAILNYEIRDEKSFGMRTENKLQTKSGKLILGGEFQTGRSNINVGGNNQGNFVDQGNNVQLPTSIFFLFGQYDWNLPANFFLTASLSYNQLNLKYNTFQNSSYVTVNERKLNSIFSPRLALLKKLTSSLSVYTSYSRGYSPPTTAEVFPSLAIYNPNLKPEYGNNYELGAKGAWKKMSGSITLYSFQLDQTIIRLDSAGSDYFSNSGHTSQNGAELFWQYADRGWRGWVSYSYNHYRFKDYEQNSNNYSGNELTGVAPNVASWGIDYIYRGAYINSTFNYVDQIPLNDANTVYANEYLLVGMRAGYQLTLNKIDLNLFAGVDNLLNKKYSLGNDLNAFGGRYYNTAAPRNFYFGLNVTLN